MVDDLSYQIPKVDTKHILIANKEDAVITAVASSYFADEGHYLPVFLFPNVGKHESSERDDFQEDGYIARIIGDRASVLINNAMARMDRCEKVILVGLTEQQKSYLRIPSKIPVVEVDDLIQVKAKLLPISQNKEEIECRSDDILTALYIAKKARKHLSINEKATKHTCTLEDGKGVVVLENGEDAFSIIGVNYAYSIDANLLVVEAFNEDGRHAIEKNIQKWRENGGHNQLQKCLNKVSARVGSVDFRRFQ